MDFQGISPSLQPIEDPFIKDRDVKLFLLRIDLMHPITGGNKLYKLKYNLEEAKKQNLPAGQAGKKILLTFGGAFSNHIAATAAAGKEHGFKTIGIIRGEEHKELNSTLTFATEQGMQLEFISRDEYRNKDSVQFINSLNQRFSDFYLIPEGGANELGVKGCKEIIKDIPIDFDHICCPCGTGTTLAGIILSIKNDQSAIGFQSLKAKGYMQKEVAKWLNHFNSSHTNWHIEEDYHFGGYAKTKPELIDFMTRFEKNNAIALDIIYTGKMMYGIVDMIQKGRFKKGATIIAVHTGGLQRDKGYKY
ncbi:MAG: 1-aminocyclopropane-1-carboxylate deaminase/D-cysteine desulfhydrase [Bacteroidota bacterium]